MYSLRQDGRHGKSPWPDDGMSRNHQHKQKNLYKKGGDNMTKEQLAKKAAEERVASEKIRQRIFDRFERTMRIAEEQERQRILDKIEAMMCIAAKQ